MGGDRPAPEPGRRAPDPALPEATRRVAAMDEILQVMFWLRGEGLSTEVGPADLTRWLGIDEPEIVPLLARLEERRWIEAAGEAGRFRLTSLGVEEAGRRFASEFADVTRPGHGECGDPDCDCQATGRPEDCKHHHPQHQPA